MPEQELYTLDEAECLARLGEAWNLYIDLPKEHPQETDQFLLAMNNAQDVIAARIARRATPELWMKPVKVIPGRLITPDVGQKKKP